MPTLSLTLDGANGTAHNWTHVSTPLSEIATLLNTTGLDYVNVQTNGLRTTQMRSFSHALQGQTKVRNTTGGSLSANDIVSLAGSYSDGTDRYPIVAKADSAAVGSWIPADGILTSSVANGADGTIASVYEVTGINTSAQSIHDPVYLNTTAGGYTYTAPSVPNVIQIIGRVTEDHASTGRILFQFPGTVVPYSLLQEVQDVTTAIDSSLLLSTAETTIVDGNILGQIDFQAPVETTGTDSRLVAASIWAEADATFSSSVNDTDLVFAVAQSETALERMRLSYDGTNVGLTFSGVTTISAGGAIITVSDPIEHSSSLKVGGGYGSTGVTVSAAGVIQANGAITSDGAVTGATLAGTISTATQNSITSASSLATVGTITSGTWSGVIDGSCTMTLGSDATGDVYFRDASGFLEKLAASTDGYVLTSTGAGSIPAWEAIPAAGATLTGSTNNTVTTVTGSNAFQGEANLTFDGTTLGVVGNAGIGATAREYGTLHVKSAASSATAPYAAADELVIEGSGSSGISIISGGTTNSGFVTFGDDAMNNTYRGAVQYYHADDQMYFYTAGSTNRMMLDSGGLVAIGVENSNANMATGLTINQAAYDNEILSLKSSDVAHGMTAHTETDTFMWIAKLSATGGGFQIRGFDDGYSIAARFAGVTSAETTTDTTSSGSTVEVHSAFKNGTSSTVQGDTANIFCVSNNDTRRVIFKGDGTIHASDTSWATALDDMPDALAARAYTTEMANREGAGLLGGMEVHAPELVQRMEDQGIVTHAELPGEGTIPGHRFLNLQKGIKFAWDIGFQQMDYMGELMEVLTHEQRDALPERMKSHFAMLKQHKAVEIKQLEN